MQSSSTYIVLNRLLKQSSPDRWESSDSDCDDLAEELFVGFEQGDPGLI